MNEEYKSYILKRIHFLFTAWIGFLVVGFLLGHGFPFHMVFINYLVISYMVLFGLVFWLGVGIGFKEEKVKEGLDEIGGEQECF